MLAILDEGGWGVITAHTEWCDENLDELKVCNCNADRFTVQGEIPCAL